MKRNGQHIFAKLPQYQILRKSIHCFLSSFMHITDRRTYSNMHTARFWTCLRSSFIIQLAKTTYLTNTIHAGTATWAYVSGAYYSKKCLRPAQLWHTNEGLYYDYICKFKCMSTTLHNQYTPKTPAMEKYTGITYIFANFVSNNTQYRPTPIATYAKINQ
jgi:hypothetical protein